MLFVVEPRFRQGVGEDHFFCEGVGQAGGDGAFVAPAFAAVHGIDEAVAADIVIGVERGVVIITGLLRGVTGLTGRENAGEQEQGEDEQVS